MTGRLLFRWVDNAWVGFWVIDQVSEHENVYPSVRTLCLWGHHSYHTGEKYQFVPRITDRIELPQEWV